MKLAHVSDTHFGTERAEVLAGLLGMLAQLRPTAVVLSGDITQRCRDRQFEAARRFIEAWPREAHRIVIPGNHDLPLYGSWRRLTGSYAPYERWMGPREALWVHDGVALLAMDATNPWRRKHGHLPTDRLRARLQEARAACGPDGLLLVAAHQPLWTAWGADKRQTLIDRHHTARAFSEARVDAVLSGHVHVPLLETSADSDPELPWRFVLCGAGTAVSRRTRPRAPNSFNVLEIDSVAPTIALTRYDWMDGRFGVRDVRPFARDANGWRHATP
jgi:3',5'-cyclic AMP phosphodiesterase CpdA